MNGTTSMPSSPADMVRWVLAIVLTSAGLFANYYYQEIAWPLRLVGWILLMGVVFALAISTNLGRKFQSFAKDARMELRKVEWPKRQETIQFTVGVVIMVLIMALALWLIDTVLLWVVKWFTG